MIKIDGLSYRQIRRAFSKRRLPYLQRMVREKGHVLEPFYSGMPSTTPAVQGELFFGVRSSVPAVAFFDRRQNKTFTMLFPGAAAEVARRLAQQGKPLLKEGTSYSNIYTGGAAEARYCIQTMRLRSLHHMASSVKLFLLLLVQPVKFLRMLGYGLLETGLAVYDFVRGVAHGKNIFKELKFIPTRVIICILLRELIRTRVKMDVARGVRIVHAAFLGYDEQAHRRGPDSAFAHWTLKGIDAAIADIHRAAQRSDCRSYRLVVYADHGQEAALSFEKHFGKSPEKAVADAVKNAGRDAVATKAEGNRDGGGILGHRTRGHLSQRRHSKVRIDNKSAAAGDRVRVTTMGPLGHVYFPRPTGPRQKARFAEALVREAKIPLVLYVTNVSVAAVNKKGTFDLEASAREVLGPSHPFADRTVRDLAQTCRHPDAGDLVISGWTPEGPPMTFAIENGAHGGPGSEETRGFVLIPNGRREPNAPLRPADLRDWVFEALSSP